MPNPLHELARDSVGEAVDQTLLVDIEVFPRREESYSSRKVTFDPDSVLQARGLKYEEAYMPRPGAVQIERKTMVMVLRSSLAGVLEHGDKIVVEDDARQWIVRSIPQMDPFGAFWICEVE